MRPIYEQYLKEYELLIHKEAHYCESRLPDGYVEYKDLVQEGRIVLMMILRKRFDPNKGKFMTLLTTALRNRYQKLIREAYTFKRACLTVVDPSMFDIMPNNSDQQKTLERKERLEEVRKVDEDIADLIQFGVPRPLFILARNKARARAVNSGRNKAGKIQFTKKVLTAYYGNHFAKVLEALKN